MTLKPKASKTVPFSLTLPANIEPGEHNGCIAVQESKPTQQSESNGIVLSFRSALRVAITVPGDINAAITFKDIRSEILAEKLLLSPVLQSKGNVSVDSNIRVGLKNVFGVMSAQKGGEFALLREEESRFNFEFDKPFWGGWYQTAGSVDYVPLREDIADRGERKTAQARSEWLFIAPHFGATLIYIVSVVALVGAAVGFGMRRRNFKLLHQATVAYTVQPGDNIQALAERAAIEWRILAKLNNLKAPYSLKSGQTINIPQGHGAKRNLKN